jgi:hypothetical protein
MFCPPATIRDLLGHAHEITLQAISSSWSDRIAPTFGLGTQRLDGLTPKHSIPLRQFDPFQNVGWSLNAMKFCCQGIGELVLSPSTHLIFDLAGIGVHVEQIRPIRGAHRRPEGEGVSGLEGLTNDGDLGARHEAQFGAAVRSRQ